MALETQGVVIKRGDGASPEVFTAIGSVTSVEGPGGEASEIDVTTLSSTAKEFIIGLKDEGTVTLNLNLDTSNTPQTGLRTDRDNGTLRNFELDLTDSPVTTLSFSAYVKSFSISVQPDSKIEASVSLRISGAVTWA